MYQIQARVKKFLVNDRWNELSIGIPTFFLDENVQGIISEEHCQDIVKNMLNPFDDDNVIVYATIKKVHYANTW